MTQEHPITPPPELFKQWEDDILNERDNIDHVLDCAWRNGFQVGADQELEACCVWLRGNDPYEHDYHQMLRAVRRPKPPSLKEQALALLDKNKTRFAVAEEDVIRLALESLPD